jgi:hypothetical protein
MNDMTDVPEASASADIEDTAWFQAASHAERPPMQAHPGWYRQYAEMEASL